MATICTSVLALPPRLAGITPCRSTDKRSSVTPISRPMIRMVTHQGRAPSSDSPTSAEPVSALSAIGSAILPKSVTWPRLAGDVPVVPVGDRGDDEHRRRPTQPPGGVVPAVDEQREQEDRDQQQPQHGEHVGEVDQRHRRRRRGGTPPVPARHRRRRPAPGEARCAARGSPRRHHQVERPRCRPRRPRTRSPTASPVRARRRTRRRPRAPGARRGRTRVLVLAGLDQHLDLGADPVLGALRGQLLGQRGDPLDPLVDLVGRAPCRVAGGLGAVLVGVAEHADRVEPGLVRNASSSARSSSVSPGKPTITLLRMPASGASAADPGESSRKSSREPKRRIRRSTGGLACWKDRSKYGATPGVRGDGLDQAGPRLGRLQVGQPHPVDARHVRRAAAAAAPARGCPGQVLAVGRGVLADQHELAHALIGQPRRLGDDVVAAVRETKEPRNDGIAQNVQRRSQPEASLSGATGPSRERARCGRHPGVARGRATSAAAAAVDRGDRQQRAPVAGTCAPGAWPPSTSASRSARSG